MFLASLINAKFHLVSGFVIGGFLAVASGQMKRSCKCTVTRYNSVKSSSESNNGMFSA